MAVALRVTVWAAPAHADARDLEAQTTAAITVKTAVAEQAAAAPETGTHPAVELEELRQRIERADFQAAEPRLQALIAGGTLAVVQHNLALELLAVCALAARREKEAEATLAELYARDPQHRLSVADLGPHIAAAFDRAARSRTTTAPVALNLTLARNTDGRPLLDVQLDDVQRAVYTLHAYVHYDSDSRLTHLVGAPGEAARFLLPEPPGSVGTLSAFVDAHAPSGARIGGVGSLEAPVRLQVIALTRATPCIAAAPAPLLRHRWWLWTSLSIAFAGLVTGSAIAAR